MASHLDLEEQEQLDQLKHFWKKYGGLISWILLIIALALAAWIGYQYRQNQQATRAAALFDEMEVAAQVQDAEKAQRVFDDLRNQYASTEYAQHGALLAAKILMDKSNVSGAKAILTWTGNEASDKGLQALARLRLASLQFEDKELDQAISTLAVAFPPEFEGLVADRKGDILSAQGKTSEAIDAYRLAYKSLKQRAEYRLLVQAKLNALGIEIEPTLPASTQGKS